ncbi:MAG: hypothetical protein ABI024_06895 [Vicinamibacterales bacterium]
MALDIPSALLSRPLLTLPIDADTSVDNATALPHLPDTALTVSVLQELLKEHHVKHPSQPDTQPDEYLPEAPNAHKQQKLPSDREGVNPRETESMPRAEDDAKTWDDSREYNDRSDVPDAGTAVPPRPPR